MTNKNPTVRGILFDKDGTLIDYHKTFMSLNRALARDLAGGNEGHACRLMVMGGWDPKTDRIKSGTPWAAGALRELADLMHEALPHRDPGEILATVNRAFDTGPARAVAVTDLPAALGRFRNSGIVLGMATNDHTRAAKETVERFGIDDMIGFVAGYDAGFGAKPQPGMLRAFCQQFDLQPSEVMVVGDNRQDIDFARAGDAGWAVGVLTGTSDRHDLAAIADDVLDDITGLHALIESLATDI